MTSKIVLLMIHVWFVASVASAQSFSIDSHTIGGGGVSAGSTFSVSGAIGQPDAGTMSSVSFSLAGGFEAIATAIQTPGAPKLTIRLSAPNSIVVAWPAPSTGFALEHATQLNAATWSNVAIAPLTVNGEQQVIVPNPSGNRFYRLRKP